MKVADESKVLCETPTPGKKATRIDRWKYELVRSAILDAVPAGDEGVEFRELPALVSARIPAGEQRGRLRFRFRALSCYHPPSSGDGVPDPQPGHIPPRP